MKESQSHVATARVVAGIGFITLGVFALLGSFGVIDASALWSMYWPLGLVLAGALVWLSNRSSWLWAVILAGAGVVAFINIHTAATFNIWGLFWPAVLVAVGLSILGRGARSHVAGDQTTADHSDQFAMLSGSEHRVTSKDYKGGKVTAVMGGVELDLRDAVIKKQAVLDVFVLVGGIEVKIPAGVRVKSNVGAILGGVETKSDSKAGKDAPLLILTGSTALGGVEVKY